MPREILIEDFVNVLLKMCKETLPKASVRTAKFFPTKAFSKIIVIEAKLKIAVKHYISLQLSKSCTFALNRVLLHIIPMIDEVIFGFAKKAPISK